MYNVEGERILKFYWQTLRTLYQEAVERTIPKAERSAYGTLVERILRQNVQLNDSASKRGGIGKQLSVATHKVWYT
jgi:hypothetical protein